MKTAFSILLFPLAMLRFILIWLVTAFFLAAVIIENKISRKKGIFHFWSSLHWGKTLLFVLGFRVKRNKILAENAYILMPNHRSYIDILLAAAYSPSTFVAKAEVGRWPFLGPGLRANQAILVKRNELKSLIGTMHLIKKSIERGISVTVFPEGTTYAGPGTKPFKNGTFKIAADMQIPIVPCAIRYGDATMAWVGNDTLLPHFFRHFWKPFSTVEITFGMPISSSDFQFLKSATEKSINKLLGEIE